MDTLGEMPPRPAAGDATRTRPTSRFKRVIWTDYGQHQAHFHIVAYTSPTKSGYESATGTRSSDDVPREAHAGAGA